MDDVMWCSTPSISTGGRATLSYDMGYGARPELQPHLLLYTSLPSKQNSYIDRGCLIPCSELRLIYLHRIVGAPPPNSSRQSSDERDDEWA